MKLHQPAVSARYASILEWLGRENRLDVLETAARLRVAPETIRRDLRVLEQDGLLQRVHGGAVPVEPSPLVVAPALSRSESEELALAERVWSQLPRSGTLLLGVGGLTLTLAHAMVAAPPERPGLSVVSTSLDIAVLLSRSRMLSVYNVGGTVAPGTRGQEGDWALSELARISVDVAVLCPAGIDVHRGATARTPAAAAIGQSEAAAAKRVLVLADAESLGLSSFVTFVGLEQIDEIYVGGEPPAASVQPFLDRGSALTVVAV